MCALGCLVPLQCNVPLRLCDPKIPSALTPYLTYRFPMPNKKETPSRWFPPKPSCFGDNTISDKDTVPHTIIRLDVYVLDYLIKDVVPRVTRCPTKTETTPNDFLKTEPFPRPHDVQHKNCPSCQVKDLLKKRALPRMKDHRRDKIQIVKLQGIFFPQKKVFFRVAAEENPVE